jgi:ubiquitin carboxyl-terminal hydrolase 7
MSAKVGEHLRHDPIKLRFTTTHQDGRQKQVLKRSLNQSIQEIVAHTYATPAATLILYERLDVSIVELETKRSLKVTWTGVQNKEEGTHPFLLPKTSSVHDLADHLARLVALSPGGTGRIRVFEIPRDGKTQREFSAGEMIGNLPDVELFAEEVPRDEADAGDADKIISVFHFSKEVARTHGVPFKFVLRPAEPFGETKKRLQARVGAADKEFAKFRFALIQVAMFKQPTYIEDGAGRARWPCAVRADASLPQTTSSTTTSSRPKTASASTTSTSRARPEQRARRRSSSADRRGTDPGLYVSISPSIACHAHEVERASPGIREYMTTT